MTLLQIENKSMRRKQGSRSSVAQKDTERAAKMIIGGGGVTRIQLIT